MFPSLDIEQTYKQANRQTDKQTNRQTDKQTNRQTYEDKQRKLKIDIFLLPCS